MPSSRLSTGPKSAGKGAPFQDSSPPFFVYTPPKILMNVDFPAPFSPTRPWISPSFKERSRPLRAYTPLNDLSSFFASNSILAIFHDLILICISLNSRAPSGSPGKFVLLLCVFLSNKLCRSVHFTFFNGLSCIIFFHLLADNVSHAFKILLYSCF